MIDRDFRDLGRDPRDYAGDSPRRRREPDPFLHRDNHSFRRDAMKATLGVAGALVIVGAYLLYLALRNGVGP
jgi:hypothetical protein